MPWAAQLGGDVARAAVDPDRPAADAGVAVADLELGRGASGAVAGSSATAALSAGESGALGTIEATRPGVSSTQPWRALPPRSVCREAKPSQRRRRSSASSM